MSGRGREDEEEEDEDEEEEEIEEEKRDIINYQVSYRACFMCIATCASNPELGHKYTLLQLPLTSRRLALEQTYSSCAASFFVVEMCVSLSLSSSVVAGAGLTQLVFRVMLA